MKKIGILISTLKSGGAEKQSLLLCKVLQDLYNTKLIVFDGSLIDKKFDNYISDNQIAVIKLHGHPIKRLYNLYKAVEGIDILFTYLPRDNLRGSIVGRFAKVKYIICGIRVFPLPFLRFHISRMIHNSVLADYTIFNNYSAKANFIKKGFNSEKSLVIQNCIETKQGHVKRHNKKIIKIITISRFSPFKDYYTALKSVSIMKNGLRASANKYSFEYNIVGYGSSEKDIRSWIREFNLHDCVNININPENLNEIYLNADIYLSTSISDGISNSIMEAMSYSLPVVTTKAGDNEYLVRHGLNGYSCALRDCGAISKCILELMSDEEERLRMGANSYKIITEEYTIEKFRCKYLSIIDKLSQSTETKNFPSL